MFLFRLISTDGGVVGYIDPRGDLTFCFQDEGALERVVLYCGDVEICDVGMMNQSNFVYSTNDSITLNFEPDGPIDHTAWAMCLRMHFTKVREIFGLIQQAGSLIDASQARKPVYYIDPQALMPTQPTVQNEKPQRLRRWNPRRLVQWAKERFVD